MNDSKMHERLKQYPKIKREIADLQQRILRTHAEGEHYPVVSDTVRESSPQYPYNARTVKVTGKNAAVAVRLKRQQERLRSLKKRLERECESIEKIILSVEDSQMRQIIRLHILDGRSWKATAHAMRKNAGQAEALRKQFERYFGKK